MSVNINNNAYQMGDSRVVDSFLKKLDAYAERDEDLDYAGIEIYSSKKSRDAIEISVECAFYDGTIKQVLSVIVSPRDKVVGGRCSFASYCGRAPETSLGSEIVWDWVTRALYEFAGITREEEYHPALESFSSRRRSIMGRRSSRYEKLNTSSYIQDDQHWEECLDMADSNRGFRVVKVPNGGSFIEAELQINNLGILSRMVNIRQTGQSRRGFAIYEVRTSGGWVEVSDGARIKIRQGGAVTIS